jgi:hypothetical protein
MWLEDLEESSIDMDPVVVVAPDELLSPSATKRSGIFDIVPKISFESTTSEELEDGIDLLDHCLGKMESCLEGLKPKLARPFLDIETSYNILVTDLSNLHSRLKNVVLQMGVQKDGNKDLHSTVFGSIHELRLRGYFLDEARAKLESIFSQLASSQSNLQAQVDSLSDEVAELQGITSQLESWSNSVDKSVEIFHKRFGIIKPLLSKFTGENKENVVDFPAPSDLFSPTTMDSNTLYRRIIDLEETVKILLGNRVVGAGAQRVGCVFQSFDDLLVWVKVKVPKERFGLFVDGHSVLEFFTLSGHIDTETGTAAFSNSQKAGFSTYKEAQLAISFKNLFPMVFGKGGSSSLDDSDCLPAIKSGDKWNNGSTGVHHQLMRNMNDVPSRMGYVITCAGCPMHWSSEMQTEIALSTIQAEYIALSQAMRKV